MGGGGWHGIYLLIYLFWKCRHFNKYLKFENILRYVIDKALNIIYINICFILCFRRKWVSGIYVSVHPLLHGCQAQSREFFLKWKYYNTLSKRNIDYLKSPSCLLIIETNEKSVKYNFYLHIKTGALLKISCVLMFYI